MILMGLSRVMLFLIFSLTGVNLIHIIAYRYRNTIETVEDKLFKWIETFLPA